VSVLNNYEDGGNWPNFNGVSSNYLIDLSVDPNDGGFSFSWAQSDLNDPNFPAFHAAVVEGDVPVHLGGDVGSPGTFQPNDADFDNNNIVDGVDFLIWQRGLANGNTHADGDANRDDVVDEIDLAIWESQYGTTLFNLNADFDEDNDVDGEDFLIWQRGLGVGSTLADGDANGDNVVDAADLAVWEAQYGITPLMIATSAATSAVPEPATAVLVLLGLAWLGTVGCRARGW
jgi:hypothetical protein